jgi:4-amino-4-deoxy-L-arabinose transferase-like glycosyltransferase
MKNVLSRSWLAPFRVQTRAWPPWGFLAWAGLAVVLLYLLGIGNHGLWGYEEPYVGATIREMASHRDFVVPTLNGRPFLEKPPLAYLLGALSCRAIGHFQPWALRLPSALQALAASGWVSFMAWRLGSPRAAAWAGVTLATSFLFFEVGHGVLVDMTLTATVTFALGLAFLALAEPHQRARWVPWFWVGVGLSFLAKGVVGPVMVLVPLALACIQERDRSLCRAFLGWNWGMAAELSLIAAWVALLWDRGGTHFLVEVFLRNSIGRFSQHPGLVPMTGVLGEHVEPWYYYLFRTPANVLPWLPLWLAALGSAVPLGRRQPRFPRRYFLPLAFAANLLLLSCSQAKREVYLLPALPITFLHLALWLDQRLTEPRPGRDAALFWTMAVSLGLVCLVSLAFPWITVREAGVSPIVAGTSGVLSLTLAAGSVNRLWNRDLPAAFKGIILQWILFLAVVVGFVVPALDRQNWVPLQAPYRRALTLKQMGASLACAGLTETQLGCSSLTLHQVLPVLESPNQLQALLSQARPVAVLVEAGWWERAQAWGVRGKVVATEADTLPAPRRFRAPVLVINREPKGATTAVTARGDGNGGQPCSGPRDLVQRTGKPFQGVPGNRELARQRRRAPFSPGSAPRHGLTQGDVGIAQLFRREEPASGQARPQGPPRFQGKRRQRQDLSDPWNEGEAHPLQELEEGVLLSLEDVGGSYRHRCKIPARGSAHPVSLATLHPFGQHAHNHEPEIMIHHEGIKVQEPRGPWIGHLHPHEDLRFRGEEAEGFHDFPFALKMGGDPRLAGVENGHR